MDNPIKTLIVEDDENDVFLTKRKLIRSNLKFDVIQVCDSVRCAKDYFDSGAVVEVVFLDLNLTDSKGVETVQKIRDFYSGLLIVVTSMEQEIVGVESIKHGADEFMTKNQFTEREIEEKIAFSLARRERWKTMNSLEKKIVAAEKIGDKIGN